MYQSKNLSMANHRTFWMKTVTTLCVLTFSLALSATTLAQAGAVFVGTNHNNTMDSSEPANQIAMYNRAANGSLTLIGYFNTGGQGSGPSKRFAGDGLGSAHSVELSQDRRFLFVTNAGSDNVSVFRVMPNSLVLTDLESTGNGKQSRRFPNSVTQHGDLVYVLNSADHGSITGFRFNQQRGTLTPIPGSTHQIRANQTYPPDTLFNPTQISFTPDGKRLVVTIKDGPTAAAGVGLIPNFTGPTGPGRVLVFDVDRNGRTSSNFTQTDLNNTGPFGFSFDRRGNLLIALFIAGPGLSAAAGSFSIGENGALSPITPVVLNGRFDTCWLENNGIYAYGANYTSGDISSYTIGSDGSLALLNPIAGVTDDLPGTPGANTQGSTPLDIRLSPDGQFLYNVLPGSGKVAAWRINSDGSLTKIGEFGGLPKTINGDMAPEERFGPGGSPAGIAVL